MSFVNERTVKATRKEARCGACSTIIPIGSSAVRWAGTTDGDFSTSMYHLDCREAEIALNRLHNTFYPDEWVGIWDLDWEDYRWLLEAYPAVAARKGITAELIAEHETERKASRIAWAAIDSQRRTTRPEQPSND